MNRNELGEIAFSLIIMFIKASHFAGKFDKLALHGVIREYIPSTAINGISRKAPRYIRLRTRETFLEFQSQLI